MGEWRWHGHAAHFVGASNCRFHMTTSVGEHVVSTVGDWIPGGHRKPQQIGYRRTFETMVFRIISTHPCGCPEINGEEVDGQGYMTAKEAEAGHLELCRKWDPAHRTPVQDVAADVARIEGDDTCK